MADFVGQCNLIDGVVEHIGDDCLVVASNELRFVVAADRAQFNLGAAVTIAVRPECIQLCAAALVSGELNSFRGRLESISFFGDHFRSEVVIGPVRLAVLSRSRPCAGDVTVKIDPKDMVILNPADQRGGDAAP